MLWILNGPVNTPLAISTAKCMCDAMPEENNRKRKKLNQEVIWIRILFIVTNRLKLEKKTNKQKTTKIQIYYKYVQRRKHWTQFKLRHSLLKEVSVLLIRVFGREIERVGGMGGVSITTSNDNYNNQHEISKTSSHVRIIEGWLGWYYWIRYEIKRFWDFSKKKKMCIKIVKFVFETAVE